MAAGVKGARVSAVRIRYCRSVQPAPPGPLAYPSDCESPMRLTSARLWALSFLAFFLCTAAWAFAGPFDAVNDERDHIFRAAGVAAGEIAPEPVAAVRGIGAYQTVPRGLTTTKRCWQSSPRTSAKCAGSPNGDRTPVRVGTAAGRYHPAYYAMVGLPLRWWPNYKGLYLARLISAAAASALLAGAFTVVCRYTRRRFTLAALLLAVTPMSLHLAAGINPNGLEIAAGVALMAGLLPLTLNRELDRVLTGPLALAGFGAVGLAVLRPTGLIYLGAAIVAVLLPTRREVLVRLWRSTAVRVWAAAVFVTVSTAVVWAVVMRSTELGPYYRLEKAMSPVQAGFVVAHVWGSEWLDQIVGVFGQVDVRLPASVYRIWQFAAAAVVLLGLAGATWVGRWRLFVVFGGCVLVPSLMQVVYVNDNGMITQGRYMLPGLVGLILLAGYFIDVGGAALPAGRSFTRIMLGLAVTVHLFSLLWTMGHWRVGQPDFGQLGLRQFNLFGDGWHPPIGSVTPVLAMMLGLTLLGWLTWRLTDDDTPARWLPAQRPVADGESTHRGEAESADPGPDEPVVVPGDGSMDGFTDPEAGSSGDGSGRSVPLAAR